MSDGDRSFSRCSQWVVNLYHLLPKAGSQIGNYNNYQSLGPTDYGTHCSAVFLTYRVSNEKAALFEAGLHILSHRPIVNFYERLRTLYDKLELNSVNWTFIRNELLNNWNGSLRLSEEPFKINGRLTGDQVKTLHLRVGGRSSIKHLVRNIQ